MSKTTLKTRPVGGLKTRESRREEDGALKKRHLSLDVRQLDKEKRTLPISFSSETRDVMTWDWELGAAVPEILSHSAGACDLAPLLNAGSVLRNHDPNQIVGVPTEAAIDDKTKRGTAQIRFGTTECAEKTFRDVADGILRGVSVGYEILAYERVKAGGRSSQGHEGPCMVATSWRVHELTLTPIPADSSVGVGRSKTPTTNKEESVMPVDPKLIRKLVRAAGLPAVFADTLIARSLESEEEVQSAIDEERKTRSRAARSKPAARASKREDTNGDGEEDEDDEMREEDEEEERAIRKDAVKIERARQAGIRDAVKAAKLDEAFANDLVERGVSIGSAREAIIKKLAESDIPAVASGARGVEVVADGGVKRVRFLGVNLARQAALQAGLGENEFVEEEQRKEGRAHISLQGFVREMLLMMGRSEARDASPLVLWQLYLRSGIQIRIGGAASNASGDLANLLSNLQNKSLARGYAMAKPTWRSWARKGSLPDFKIAPWIQPSDTAALRETGENGEILDSKLSDRAENRQLAVYARSVSLTWEMFQNDDLDGLGKLPFMLGKSAAQLPSRLIYTHLLSGSNAEGPTMSDGVQLFHAASHGNLRTGAGSNLDASNKVAALTQAVMDFRKQTAPKAPNDTEFPAEPVDIEPRILVVPPEHEFAASQLVNPNLFVAETQFFKGKFQLEVEPRLSNSAYTGYSATAWFLAAAAEEADTAEVSFLNGQEAPITANWEDFDRLALRMRAVLPCGVKALDWRTIHKSKGA